MRPLTWLGLWLWVLKERLSFHKYKKCGACHRRKPDYCFGLYRNYCIKCMFIHDDIQEDLVELYGTMLGLRSYRQFMFEVENFFNGAKDDESNVVSRKAE